MCHVFRKDGNYIITQLQVLKKLEVREGVEPPCIGFAGPRITALPPHRSEKNTFVTIKLFSSEFCK